MRTAAPVVFSEAWFDAHQTWLLRLLAWPFIGRLSRRVFAIRPHDVGWARPIVALYPHAYVVDNGDGTYTMDCRTHVKYAKRLHYVLWPVWLALHAWDAWFANPFVPALNAGFDTLTVYPNPSGSGNGDFLHDGPSGVWATARGSNPMLNTSWGMNGTVVSSGFAQIETTSTASNWRLFRSSFTFDTSPLTANAIVTATTMSLWHTTDSGVDALAISPQYDVYGAVLDSYSAPTSVTMGTISLTGAPLLGSAISATIAGGASPQYIPWTLNAYGRSVIAVTGVTATLVREVVSDVANVEPTWTTANVYSRIFGDFADQTGSASDPKLDITFTLSSPILGPNSLRPRVFAPGRAR